MHSSSPCNMDTHKESRIHELGLQVSALRSTDNATSLARRRVCFTARSIRWKVRRLKLEESFRICLEEMPKDLRACSSDIRWAFNDGFQPCQPKERTSGLLVGPDQVKGPKYDFGLGSHKSREAYNTACKLLKATEVALACSLLLATGNDRYKKLSRRDKPVLVIDHCLTLLATLESLEEVSSDSQRLVLKAYKTSWQCRCSLQSAFYEPARIQQPTLEASRCSICEIRLASEKAAGGRCDTCYQYLRRKGKERPKELDKGQPSFYEEALQAQRKRHTLGAGYGAS